MALSLVFLSFMHERRALMCHQNVKCVPVDARYLPSGGTLVEAVSEAMFSSSAEGRSCQRV